MLVVDRKNALYELTFPVKIPAKLSEPERLGKHLNMEILEAYSDRDLYLVLDSQEAVARYVPDYDKLAMLKDWLGIVITAEGGEADFVSRYFVLN